MSNPILNSALTGEADFAAHMFGSQQEQAPAETAPEPKQEAPPQETKPEPEVKATPEKKVVPTKEPVKEPATKKDPEKKADPENTETTSTDEESGDFPVNPHFQDKTVSDTPEGDKSEKGIVAWKEAKAEIKRLREQRDLLNAELKVAQESVSKSVEIEQKALQSELEEYKTKLAELSRELKAANFERTPEYVENIKKPMSALEQDVRSIAEANGADFGKIWQAITEPDIRKRTDTLEDLISDFKRVEQFEIVKLSEKYHSLNSYKERFSKEAESLLEEERAIAAQRDMEFRENDLRLQKTFAAKTWAQLEDKFDFLQEIDGEEQWNTQIRNARRNASETNLDKLSVEARSSILAKAAVVPFLESAVKHYSEKAVAIAEQKDKQISELQAQIDSLVKSTPGLGGGEEKVVDDEPKYSDKDLTDLGGAIFGRR